MLKEEKDMLSLEDYLNMTDWESAPFAYKDYSHEDYHWIEFDGWADPLKAIEPPTKPLWIILTAIADFRPAELIPEGTGRIGDSEIIWTKFGDDYLISPPLSKIPTLEFGAELALIAIDKEHSLDTISNAMLGFENFSSLTNDEQWTSFFEAANTLGMVFCYENLADLILLTRGKELINQFLESDEVKSAPERRLQHQKRLRQEEWEKDGPELGPDTCLAEDCDRLTIKGYPRCFMHQKQFWANLSTR